LEASIKPGHSSRSSQSILTVLSAAGEGEINDLRNASSLKLSASHLWQRWSNSWVGEVEVIVISYYLVMMAIMTSSSMLMMLVALQADNDNASSGGVSRDTLECLAFSFICNCLLYFEIEFPVNTVTQLITKGLK
jgi:hypothetical protein